MISLKAPHNNLMPYTQQSILNTVKNNQLPEDIKSSPVSCVDIFKVLIKQYYDYPYDCRDDLVDDDKLIHLMAAVRDCEWLDDNALTINVQFNDFPDFMTGWITLITRLSLFFAYLKIKKGQFGYMTRMMRFLILKQMCRLDALPGLRN